MKVVDSFPHICLPKGFMIIKQISTGVSIKNGKNSIPTFKEILINIL